jgi:SAM-dependent methyltransferase
VEPQRPYGRWVARQASGRVLDVGCGTGNLVARLRHKAISVTGIEPSPSMARIATERFADDPGVTILETTFAGRDPNAGTPSPSWPSCTTFHWCPP